MDPRSASGPNSFGTRLATKFVETGHQVFLQPSNLNLIFIEYPAELPQGSKNILRLDGIWTRSDQVSHNKRIRQLYESCDAIVWQSEYDKNVIQALWGAPKLGEVIHNGIEQHLVDVQDIEILRLRQAYDQIFVCSAAWHEQKRLAANIEFFQLNKGNKRSILLVLGQLGNTASLENCRLDDVKFCGPVSHDVCLQVYRVADWMLHLAWRDHCPNVVVEALSQGCPVVCASSGGTKELVKSNGVILEDTLDNTINQLVFDYDAPPKIAMSQNLQHVNFDAKLVPTITQSYEKYYNLCRNVMGL